MNDYVCTVVEDAKKADDDVVVVINDTYDHSEHCDFALPVAESADLPYVVVKEVKEDPNKLYNVSYYGL